MSTDEVMSQLAAAYSLERMRAFLREEVRRVGKRQTARQLNVERDALRQFMDGGLPEPELWHAVTELMLDRPSPELTPGAVAVALLTNQHPPSKRPEVRARITAALQSSGAGVAI